MQNCLLIATLRIRKNMSQDDMAHILKVSLRTYKNYECGKSCMSLAELNILSNYFKVSLNALLNLTTNLKINVIQDQINYPLLGYNLRYLRLKRSLTQDTLARLFNISKNSISRYEVYPKCVNLKYLQKICQEFKISADYLCGKSIKKEV